MLLEMIEILMTASNGINILERLTEKGRNQCDSKIGKVKMISIST